MKFECRQQLKMPFLEHILSNTSFINTSQPRSLSLSLSPPTFKGKALGTRLYLQE